MQEEINLPLVCALLAALGQRLPPRVTMHPGRNGTPVRISSIAPADQTASEVCEGECCSGREEGK